MACQMVYHNGNCLNTKKPFARACRKCIEGCPQQAISEYRQLDGKRCTECGACMAGCPSDGFVDRNMDKLHDALFGAEEVILNCPQALPAGFEISCIGILDRDSWMALMLLAREKSVTVMTGVCAECQDRQACAASVQVFKQVHADWVDHPMVKIQVRPDTGEEGLPAENASLKPVARRTAMSGLRLRSREKVEEWLPSLVADEAYLIPKSRQWLLEALEKSPEVKIPFRALAVSDACTSCGVCAAICPQGALQKREERGLGVEGEAQEKKVQTMRLILEPQKCVQCNRCVEVCRPQALSVEKKWLTHRLLTGKILIHEGSPKYCSRCGKQIFDNGDLCLACSTSDPDGRGFFFL